MAYVIKRYTNRKLYDAQERRYVTLEELEGMIRAGRQITVRDAASGEDLTSVTLAQILLEKERQQRAVLPTAFLHQLIQYGEAWQDFVLTSLKAHLEGLITSQREADRVFRNWMVQCGWLPPTQTGASVDYHAAKPGELAALKDEVAELRAQLQALAQRLEQRQEPERTPAASPDRTGMG